ncbi:orexin receptor type 2-like [Mizuhopecten yessoensis]|uniref:Orexin receptor type 2 n=1 Tax=Mizuhopecten yessoensis TaxID=6573 RepID=A0A210PQS4_MIZYE|nr:orexin receptor type 2-like [Mizuhopecten yessoensis]XP_021377585.1 orexin receptor type 2-like [Mizuhopecten yessoensis]OWF38845.1 Orexin receptor type 2 [Mizuhopecten yessoensis]
MDVSTQDVVSTSFEKFVDQTMTSMIGLTNQTTLSSYIIENSSEINLFLLNSQMARKLLPVTIFVYILMFFGLIGNSVVVYVYLFRWKSTTIKYFIGYLATLDLVTSGLCMPLEIVLYTNPVTANSSALCRVLRFSRAVTSIAEAFLLVVIAVDRYLRVCKYTQTQISVKKAKQLCILSFTFSLCLSWPSLFVFGSYDRGTYPVLQTSCSTVQHLRGTVYPLLYYAMLFLVFIIVSVCLFVFYILVGIKLCRLSSKQKLSISKGTSEKFKPTKSGYFPPDMLKDDSRSGTLKKNEGRRTIDRNNRNAAKRKSSFVDLSQVSINLKSVRRRSTRMMRKQKTSLTLFLITALEFISFLPYIVIMIYKAVEPHFLETLSESQQILYNIGLLSYFLATAFNPFIYGFFSRNFRRKCVEILRSVKNGRNDNNTYSSGTDKKVSTSK